MDGKKVMNYLKKHLNQNKIKIMKNKTFGLCFGIFDKTLSQQLKSQKIDFDKEKMNLFERKRKALNELEFTSLVSDKTIEMAFIRLQNEVLKHIKTINKNK